jgi:hypothetical protein
MKNKEYRQAHEELAPEFALGPGHPRGRLSVWLLQPERASGSRLSRQRRIQAVQRLQTSGVRYPQGWSACTPQPCEYSCFLPLDIRRPPSDQSKSHGYINLRVLLRRC